MRPIFKIEIGHSIVLKLLLKIEALLTDDGGTEKPEELLNSTHADM